MKILAIVTGVIVFITLVYAHGGFYGNVKRGDTGENAVEATVHWWGAQTDSVLTNKEGNYWKQDQNNGNYTITAHRLIDGYWYTALNKDTTINEDMVLVNHTIVWPDPNK